MINCVVIGESWIASEVAGLLGVRAVTLEQAKNHRLGLRPVVIHADSCPDLDKPLEMWAWVLRTLIARCVFSNEHWIQLSLADVLAGGNYKRPHRASDSINPYELRGKASASLEWGLASLRYPLTIVRSSLLYNDSPESLLGWANGIIAQGIGRVPADKFNPTPIKRFAGAIESLAMSRRLGIVHAACGEVATYVDVVNFIASVSGRDEPELELDTKRLVNFSLTSSMKLGKWKDAMKEYL